MKQLFVRTLSFDLLLKALYLPADKEEKEKSDSGVETQNSEGAVDEEPLGPKCFYNKSKSFFDNISSELKSRYFKLVIFLFSSTVSWDCTMVSKAVGNHVTNHSSRCTKW